MDESEESVKTPKKIIEMCCVCGFIHRHDLMEPPVRSYMPHYHWIPDHGEYVTPNNVCYSAIICATCVNIYKQVDWKEFTKHQSMSSEHKSNHLLNAPLPDQYLIKYNSVYYYMIEHLFNYKFN
jgi:hypothetical protein